MAEFTDGLGDNIGVDRNDGFPIGSWRNSPINIKIRTDIINSFRE